MGCINQLVTGVPSCIGLDSPKREKRWFWHNQPYKYNHRSPTILHFPTWTMNFCRHSLPQAGSSQRDATPTRVPANLSSLWSSLPRLGAAKEISPELRFISPKLVMYILHAVYITKIAMETGQSAGLLFHDFSFFANVTEVLVMPKSTVNLRTNQGFL